MFLHCYSKFQYLLILSCYVKLTRILVKVGKDSWGKDSSGFESGGYYRQKDNSIQTRRC